MPKSAVSSVRLLDQPSQSLPANSVFLSRPDTACHSAEVEGPLHTIALTCMQSWRRTMEDAHTIELELAPKVALYAVFDGHGGIDTALFAAQNMASWITRTPEFKAGRYAEALRRAYIEGDAEICRIARQTERPNTGSTAVACIVTPTHVYCANVGDSRALLIRGTRALDLSHDHKPTLEEEAKRVVQNGGVILNGRVNGMLAMTRALGDPILKNPDEKPERQVVTAVPDVTSVQLEDSDVALVLACDGIWDCVQSSEVALFFLEEMQEHNDYALMCENLCENLVAPTLHHYGTDNMTVVLVRLRDHCKRPPSPPPCDVMSPLGGPPGDRTRARFGSRPSSATRSRPGTGTSRSSPSPTDAVRPGSAASGGSRGFGPGR